MAHRVIGLSHSDIGGSWSFSYAFCNDPRSLDLLWSDLSFKHCRASSAGGPVFFCSFCVGTCRCITMGLCGVFHTKTVWSRGPSLNWSWIDVHCKPLAILSQADHFFDVQRRPRTKEETMTERVIRKQKTTAVVTKTINRVYEQLLPKPSHKNNPKSSSQNQKNQHIHTSTHQENQQIFQKDLNAKKKQKGRHLSQEACWSWAIHQRTSTATWTLTSARLGAGCRPGCLGFFFPFLKGVLDTKQIQANVFLRSVLGYETILNNPKLLRQGVWE